WLASVAARPDWVPFASVKRADGAAAGIISYMRIETGHGVVEIGCVLFGPELKRSTEATEAIALMAANAFDGLFYRRLEWKCDTRNAASKAAATRFGFRFEGVFRNHMVLKGENRDTAWLA